MFRPSGRITFEQLYALTFAEIVGGRFRSGDRIAIKDLAARLEVSTTPLREILSRLTGRGIVEERRSEGYYLARLDAGDIARLYLLHAECVLMALADARPATIDRSADPSAWRVFEAIVAGTRDAVLTDVRRYISDRLTLLRPYEAQLIEDMPIESETLAFAIASEPGAARDAVIAFHDRRRAIAPDLALLFGRGLR